MKRKSIQVNIAGLNINIHFEEATGKPMISADDFALSHGYDNLEEMLVSEKRGIENIISLINNSK
jgi:hypothetical protein